MVFMVTILGAAAYPASSNSCTEKGAEIANVLIDKPTVDLTNLIIRHSVPKTIGVCAGLDPSLLPCKNVSKFPVHKSGGDYKVDVDYVTGLNTLNMTNVSVRCDNTTFLTPLDGRRWFVEIDGTFDNLLVPAHAHIDFPPMSPTINVNPKDLQFHAVGRIDCYDKSSFGIQLDPMTNSFSMSDIKVHYSVIDKNITPDIVKAVKEAVNKAQFKAPKALQGLVDLICKNQKAREDQLIIV